MSERGEKFGEDKPITNLTEAYQKSDQDFLKLLEERQGSGLLELNISVDEINEPLLLEFLSKRPTQSHERKININGTEEEIEQMKLLFPKIAPLVNWERIKK